MLTNDINALTPGQGCYATFLTPQGRTLADMRVYCLEESLLLVVEPDLQEKVITSLRKFTIGNRVELLDRSEELALLSIQGPKSGEFLSQVMPSVNLSLQPFGHSRLDIGTTQVLCCRVNRTASGGYDLLVPQQNLVEIWTLFSEMDKSVAIGPVGLNALNVHRVEAGIPLYGVDVDETHIPLEAGLDNAISLKKGCYIGQEIIARATYLGHLNRKLAGLLLTGEQAVTKGDRVFREEKDIGWITSSVYSLSLRKPIALGYLRREVLAPGTSLVVDHKPVRIHCEVTTLPFVTNSTQEAI
jgi:folate-binding protein YgfZ